MSQPIDLSRLAEPFPPDDIEWLPGVTTKDKSKALAFPYVNNRAIMDRLDEVCGPENWRNEFEAGPGGGVLCGISVRVAYPDGGPDGGPSAAWVTKWDGAENTDVEAVKGGLSSAQKRAAMQWGIGRYFAKIPPQWVRLDERGRFAETPRIPKAFLPGTSGSAVGSAPPESARQTPQPAPRPEPQAVPQAAPRAQSSPAPQSAAPPTPRVGERRVIRPAEPAPAKAGDNGHAHPAR